MYRSVNDALLLRAAVLRPDQVGSWPDLTSNDAADSRRLWLAGTALTVPGFAAAVAHASPDLTERAAAVISGTASATNTRAVTLAVLRYLLRATTRATPFGLFAGVAPATANRDGSIRWGDAHRPVARLQASWLAVVLDRLESDARLRPHLMVCANNLLVHRADRLVLEYRADPSDPRGAPTHLRITATEVIRAALALTAEPIRWADLIDKLVADDAGPREGAQRLISQMVSQRLLLTNLRPPSTATDPLRYVVDQLGSIAAEGGDSASYRVSSAGFVISRPGTIMHRTRQPPTPASGTSARPPP